jgi:hypothetical protein
MDPKEPIALSTLQLEFSKGNYVVDTLKNLYKKEGENAVFVSKLKKNVFDILHFEGEDYLMDLFGDFYKIEQNVRFIFGILCSPVLLTVFNGKIAVADKYNRIQIVDFTGKIEKFLFIKEKIQNMQAEQRNMKVITCSQTRVYNSSYDLL